MSRFFYNIHCCMIWWRIFKSLFSILLFCICLQGESCEQALSQLIWFWILKCFLLNVPVSKTEEETLISLCHLHSWQLNLVTSSLQALNECTWNLDYLMKGTGWYDAISWAHRCMWWTAGALWDFLKELNQSHENDRSSLNEKGSELGQLIF